MAPEKLKALAAGAIGLVAALVIADQLRRLLAQTNTETMTTVPGPPAPERSAPDLAATAHRPETYSNIYQYDYVGPEVCGRCHPKNYDSWRQHPHSKMNKNASASTVVGDFSGTKLDYADGRVVFSKGGGDLTMTLYRQDKFVRQLKVTRVIGSRFVQMYAGIQIQGPEPPNDPVYSQEVKLPFAYWIDRKEWFPETFDETPATGEYDQKGLLTPFYSFYEKPAGSWKRICIKCHNTFPYATRFTAVAEGRLAGFPAEDIKLHEKPGATRDPKAMPDLEPWELVTLGISCESCHFGGREHALQGAAISFLPRSQDVEFPKATKERMASARKDPYVINSICKQCHAADAQGPTFPNGAGSWNSREALDLAAGSCTSKILCTSCHDPHVAGPSGDSAKAPDEKRFSETCIGCHDKYRTPSAAAAHAGHTESDHLSCVDCHMPRMVHGLNGVVRSHRISSPTDVKMLAGDFPNACNLCHLDRSVKWTLDAITAKWGKTVDFPSASEDPAGPRWLKHKEAVVRTLAADAYSRSPLGKAALPDILPILVDGTPPSRMFGVLAVERITGKELPVALYSPWARPAERAEQVAAIAARAK